MGSSSPQVGGGGGAGFVSLPPAAGLAAGAAPPLVEVVPGWWYGVITVVRSRTEVFHVQVGVRPQAEHWPAGTAYLFRSPRHPGRARPRECGQQLQTHALGPVRGQQETGGRGCCHGGIHGRRKGQVRLEHSPLPVEVQGHCRRLGKKWADTVVQSNFKFGSFKLFSGPVDKPRIQVTSASKEKKYHSGNCASI